MSKIDAMIMAGSPAGVEMSPQNPSISRAMIDLGGKPMVQWVIDALRQSPSIGRIIAVGEIDSQGIDDVIEPGESLVDNIKLGIEKLGGDMPVLVVSCDIPLLTSEGVEDFISQAINLDADMAYPIIDKSCCDKLYPDLKRTYLKTGDGTFTGGNLMLVRPDFVRNNWGAVAGAYAARKQILKLARMIGLGVLARVIIGQVIPGVLRVNILERAASKMLGANLKAVISAFPEIGEDVDKLSDLDIARRILAGRRG